MNFEDIVKEYEEVNAQFLAMLNRQHELGSQIIKALEKAFLDTKKYDDATMPRISIQKVENGNVKFLLWEAVECLDAITLSGKKLSGELTLEDLKTSGDIRMEELEKNDPDWINHGEFDREIVIPGAQAYWISPSGQVLPVYHRHIHEVVSSPASFGLTAEYISEAYQRHKEPIGFEGKARGEIMENLIHFGWIRLRVDERRGAWTIELSELTTGVKDYLWSWAKALIDANPGHQYYNVCIDEFDKEFTITKITLQDLADDKLLTDEEKQKRIRRTLRPVKTAADFLPQGVP